MAEHLESQSGSQPIQLKDPLVAGVLAWLVPGLGHFYQGRNAKGALFTICILGTFLYGLYLGGNGEVGWGRAVYFSFRPDDWRLPWLCQIGVGLPTVPVTLLQYEMQDNPFCGGFMAPPYIQRFDEQGRPLPVPPGKITLAMINRKFPRPFEMGTVYTMIAGLLNLLAVYDACCGPVPAESSKEDDEKPQGKKESEKGEMKS